MPKVAQAWSPSRRAVGAEEHPLRADPRDCFLELLVKEDRAGLEVCVRVAFRARDAPLHAAHVPQPTHVPEDDRGAQPLGHGQRLVHVAPEGVEDHWEAQLLDALKHPPEVRRIRIDGVAAVVDLEAAQAELFDRFRHDLRAVVGVAHAAETDEAVGVLCHVACDLAIGRAVVPIGHGEDYGAIDLGLVHLAEELVGIETVLKRPGGRVIAPAEMGVKVDYHRE